MLIYSHIITKVLHQEVLPVMQELVSRSMTGEYGPNWYEKKAQQVFCHYRDYEKIAPAIAANPEDPTRGMDLTALFFLLNPYVDDKTKLTGFRDVIVSRGNLTDWQSRKLDRIRKIRNYAAHPALSNVLPEEQEDALRGVMEQDMLLELEEILHSFRPELSLYEYQQELKEQVAEQIARQNEAPEARTHFMDKTEELRPELRRIYDAPYFSAKLQMPKREYLDFIDASDERLPWPVAPAPSSQYYPDSRKERDPIIEIMKQLSEAEKALTPEWNQCFSMGEAEQGKTDRNGDTKGVRQPRPAARQAQQPNASKQVPQRKAGKPAPKTAASDVMADMVDDVVDKAASFLSGIFKRRS